MVYRAIGVTNENLQEGLHIVFAELQELGGKWTFETIHSEHISYSAEWVSRLQAATELAAKDYQLLHIEYGHYLGKQLNSFIEKNNLQYKVAVIASQGYTTFDLPTEKLFVQLGDGAAIAALTRLPVVTDLFGIDTALGGKEKNWEVLKQKFSDDLINSANPSILCALMGVLRWREEYNVFASASGASRNSVGGALWMGQDA